MQVHAGGVDDQPVLAAAALGLMAPEPPSSALAPIPVPVPADAAASDPLPDDVNDDASVGTAMAGVAPALLQHMQLRPLTQLNPSQRHRIAQRRAFRLHLQRALAQQGILCTGRSIRSALSV